MPIVVFLSFLFLWHSIGKAELPDLETHQQVWQDLVKDCWRVKKIGRESIYDFLFNLFIERAKLVKFCRPFLSDDKLHEDLGDTLRSWQRVLNLRELKRFKEKFTKEATIISDHNFNTDDVVRARSLCGIFYKRTQFGNNPARYDRKFSGMLEPGQTYLEGNEANTKGYFTHTCLHGFHEVGKISTIYFVPYGLDPTDENAFPIKFLKYFAGGRWHKINQTYIDEYSAKSERPYRRSDYLLVEIEAISKGGKDLKTAMRENGIPYFKRQESNSLPNLIGFSDNFDLTQPPGFPKLFIIGMASEEETALEKGFNVATNLTSVNPNLQGKKRSFRDDPEKNQAAEDIRDFLSSEFLSDYPTYPGMSGGPILECKLVQMQNTWQRRCRLKGINFGSERVFDDDRKLIGLNSIGVSIPKE